MASWGLSSFGTEDARLVCFHRDWTLAKGHLECFRLCRRGAALRHKEHPQKVTVGKGAYRSWETGAQLIKGPGRPGLERTAFATLATALSPKSISLVPCMSINKQ